MSKANRFCPLCEETMDATVCPKHGVPTVADGVFDKEDPLLGATFSNSYRIKGVLGEGAMGRVYRATQINMERPVALKTLHTHLVSDRDLMRRFYREARSASQLLSPHVVRVFDFGVDDATGTPFIAMEILEGSDLGDLIKKDGPLAVDRASRLLLQVSQALREAERKGIVHRDLKPDNVFVSNTVDVDDDFVKVVDFGIAKVLGAGSGMTSDLTATGKTVGTPQYMAPEQVRGGDVDIRADLYSLGCILHTVLTGRPPFHGDDAMSIMMRHLSAPAPPLPETLASGEKPPALLVELHTALLAKKVEDRPSGADVVYRAFRALERQQEISLAKLEKTAGSRTTGTNALPAKAAPSGHAPTVAKIATRELQGASPSAATRHADASIPLADSEPGAFGLDEDPLDALSGLVGAWPDDQKPQEGSSGEQDAFPLALATGAAHEAVQAPPTSMPPPQEEKVPLPLIILAAVVLLGVGGGGAWYFMAGPGATASAPVAQSASGPSPSSVAAEASGEEAAGAGVKAGTEPDPSPAPAAAVQAPPADPVAPAEPRPTEPVVEDPAAAAATADATSDDDADEGDADTDADNGPTAASPEPEAKQTPTPSAAKPAVARKKTSPTAAKKTTTKKASTARRPVAKKPVAKKPVAKRADKQPAAKKTEPKAEKKKKASTAVPW